jgi:23S rRNA pseudouridine2605 synthase
MPPRHAYWTILIGDQPTAFRAHDPEELLPTLNRLRQKNASAVMKWFERGRLFDSREAARQAGFGVGERRWEGPRPEREDQAPAPAHRGAGASRPRESSDRPRDKTWRPGGEHRDPRQKYKDAKKAKWTRFKQHVRGRHVEGARDEGRPDRSPEKSTIGPERPSPPHREFRRDRGGERREIELRKDVGHPARARDQFRPREDRPDWRRPRDEGRTRGSERPDQWRPRGGPPAGGASPSTWKPKGPPRDRDRRAGGAGKKPFGVKPGGGKPGGWKGPRGAGTKPWGSKPSGRPGGYGAGGRSRDLNQGPRPGGRWNQSPGDRPPKRRRDDDE